MLIGFDASRAFVREATGTENYSLNLLKALAKVDRKNRYRVYLRSFAGPVSSFLPASAPRPFLNSDEIPDLKFDSKKGRVRAVGPAKPDSSAATRKTDFNWPSNFEFKVIRPNRLWTQVGLAWETWRNPVDVLFIPAHTLPILRRRKIRISNCSLSRILFRKSKFQISNFSKCVVTIHDLGVEYLPGYHKFPDRYYLDFASRYAVKHAEGIIAVSKATRSDLVKRYGSDAKKISVVWEGVDREFFKPQSKKKIQNAKIKYQIDGNYILFVGTIQPRKNLITLIQAFSSLVNSEKWKVTSHHALDTNHLSLVIAGKLGWDYEEILAAPKKYGIKNKVKFIGRVNDSDLPALYSGARVFAFPSLFEGFGLPILEALACGCPVVASNIGPHREIVAGLKIPKAIVLVKPDRANEWAKFLYQSITNSNKRLTLVSGEFLRLDDFSWKNAALKTLEVFSAVCC